MEINGFKYIILMLTITIYVVFTIIVISFGKKKLVNLSIDKLSKKLALLKKGLKISLIGDIILFILYCLLGIPNVFLLICVIFLLLSVIYFYLLEIYYIKHIIKKIKNSN